MTQTVDYNQTNVLENLFVSGVCVSLHIKTWRARKKASAFFKELGIEEKMWSDNILTVSMDNTTALVRLRPKNTNDNNR